MSKRIITRDEISHVLRLARSGVYLREIERRTGISTNGITGICDRAGARLTKAKPGPQRVAVQG